MDMQNAARLDIPEGEVRTIHDKDGNLIWGKVSYGVEYKGETSQQTYSGKNLLNFIGQSNGGVAGTVTDGSTITVAGKATVSTGVNVASLASIIPAGTYTFTIDHAATHVINFTVNTSGGNIAFRLGAGETSVTRTLASASTGGQVFWAITNGTSYNETFKLQLVAGSTPDYDYEPYVGGIPAPNPDYPQAVQTVTGENVVKISDGQGNEQSYTIDLGSIELCKIGNYQDYIYKSGGKWYVHKEVGKISSYAGETISTDYISTTGQLTTGATVYYALAAPTDTEITDEAFVAQLENVEQWLTRYGYNATVSGNLPIVIDRTAL